MASIQMTAMMQGNYTEVFRQKSFFKVELLRTDAFTRGAFTHRSFYTEGPVHTDAFTTQQLWHRGACIHRSYYTEELLHTDAFTQRIFCTEKLLHTDAFTHKRSYTQKLLRKQPLHGEPLPQRTFVTLIDVAKSQFRTSFFRLDPRFVWKGCIWDFKIAILHLFLTLDPNVVRKGDADTHKNRISPRVVLDTHDPRRVAPDWQNSHFAIGLCVRRARSLQRAATDEAEFAIHHTFVRHARSLQGVTFCKPVFGCTCCLQRESRKTSEVGVP